MEEPFELILQFRYQNQKKDSPPVWWRLPKDKRPASFPEELGIAPANILLLYK
jgi:molybdate transport system ATP-binding protein